MPRSSDEITIEERDPEEVLGVWGIVKKTSLEKRQLIDEYAFVRVANPTSTARNPALILHRQNLLPALLHQQEFLNPVEIRNINKKLNRT
jgi:methylthioribose-1-phosphate isomerase